MSLSKLKRLHAAATPAPFIDDGYRVMDAAGNLIYEYKHNDQINYKDHQLMTLLRNQLPNIIALVEAAKCMSFALETGYCDRDGNIVGIRNPDREAARKLLEALKPFDEPLANK